VPLAGRPDHGHPVAADQGHQSKKKKKKKQPRAGRTVGIATPVHIQFSADGSRPGRRRARALRVTNRSATDGSWGWLQDEGGGSRVHTRTKVMEHRAPEVTLYAKPSSGRLRRGATGRQTSSQPPFTDRSRAGSPRHVTSHRLVVLRDGAQVASYRPATASTPTRTGNTQLRRAE